MQVGVDPEKLRELDEQNHFRNQSGQESGRGRPQTKKGNAKKGDLLRRKNVEKKGKKQERVKSREMKLKRRERNGERERKKEL